jgi:ankyrin repeat protein
MSEQTPESGGGALPLPESPNLEWLRKQAKRRLAELRKSNGDAQLTDAQFELAKQYGFPSWRALKAHIESLTLDGRLIAAARAGDVATLGALLDAHPEKLLVRAPPYGFTLLHLAAQHVDAVDFLLKRGLDPNSRENGDNTYAMHWAAAAGQLGVVRRLMDAGGDVVGRGDDHQLEMIGWATCWDGCDDAAHHAVVDLLLEHGAKHHIFSAVAMNLEDEVRRIVAADHASLERRMSHNEDFQRPLHFAVRKRLPEMVALLIELGADPLATDGSGNRSAIHATTPGIDRPVLEAIRSRGEMDLFTALALHDWSAADRIFRENPHATDTGGASAGALSMLAKRNELAGVQWLLERGSNPNTRWSHWDSELTALHLAAWQGHVDVARALLDAGADASIHDSKHESDVLGWAEFAGQLEVVRLLRSRGVGR